MPEVRILLLEENVWVRQCLWRCLNADLIKNGLRPIIFLARNAREAFVTLEQERFHIAILNHNSPIPGSHIRHNEHISDYVCRHFPETKVLLKNRDFWVLHLPQDERHVLAEDNIIKIILGLIPRKTYLRLVK